MATEKSKGNSGYIRERELQILIRLNQKLKFNYANPCGREA